MMEEKTEVEGRKQRQREKDPQETRDDLPRRKNAAGAIGFKASLEGALRWVTGVRSLTHESRVRTRTREPDTRLAADT